jgi:hypothetical protein
MQKAEKIKMLLAEPDKAASLGLHRCERCGVPYKKQHKKCTDKNVNTYQGELFKQREKTAQPRARL